MPRAAPSKPPPALEQQLSYRLHLLHKITDLESQRRYPIDTGLSLSDGRCLAAIGAFGPLSINALAQSANLDKAQASRGARQLATMGMVTRTESATDGRGVVLSLTPSGRRTFRKTMALITQRNHEIFGCLSAAEQRTLSEMLGRLIGHARHAPTQR